MDRPSFRREQRPAPSRQRLVMMAFLLILCAGLLLGRSWLVSGVSDPQFEVVEVQGLVPRPGFHTVVKPVTVAKAVMAAGGQSTDPAPVPAGSRITLESDGARVAPMDKRLVFGLPIGLNTASRAQLVAVPGIGPVRAEAILAERAAAGAFRSVDDLTRVRGIGPATVERIRPFLAVD